ncbi:MAG: hypothetical protein QOF91_549 [Alphaproteobacteria bacterium]|nr:hypothetical protein [Alphaproteobacteria bacterium]
MAIVRDLYPSFESAMAACGDGYNAGDLADVVSFMTTAVPVNKHAFAPEQAVYSILAVALAGAQVSGRPLTVLDFGGACGFAYFRVSPAVSVPLQWAIVETPAMAERAAKTGQGKFSAYPDLSEAAKSLGQIDLIHASGSVQFMPDPIATLKDFAALQPRYIAITRFPLWLDRQTVGIQESTLAGNGWGPMPPNIPDRKVKYPVTFANFNDVMRALHCYDMDLVVPATSADYYVQGRRVQGLTAIFRRLGQQVATYLVVFLEVMPL